MNLVVGGIALSLLTALCGTADEPMPGDRGAGPAFIDDVELLMLESYPVQVGAVVRGTLPDPCHQLEWKLSASGDRIDVEVFSTFEVGLDCIAVVEEFEATIDIGDFENGEYLLVVNGVEYPFQI